MNIIVVDMAIGRDDVGVVSSMQVKVLRFGKLISENVVILVDDLGNFCADYLNPRVTTHPIYPEVNGTD